MRILVTGAAGMIGRKLAQRLLGDGALGARALEALVLHDVVAPDVDSPLVTVLAGDLSAPGAVEELVAHRPDVIVHLAGVVSGEAEADFDKGYRVNLDGTRALLEAVRAAEAFRPEVVLLDIGLPRLNGYEAARRIREQPWGEGLVLIAVTGWGQEEDKRRSKEAGFNFHLVKPVEPDALEKLLGGLLTPARSADPTEGGPGSGRTGS